MQVTRETIKHQSDFESRSEFIDYLHELCEIGLSRELICGRISRHHKPFDAITTPKIRKPGRSHPYKRQFAQEIERKKQHV